MASAALSDFAPMMGPVAKKLLGEPSKALSTRSSLRWGNKGSLAVDLAKGTYFDHEANIGGGTLDLVMREQRCDKAGALAWLERQGLIEPKARSDARTVAPVFYDYRDASGRVAYRVERRGKNCTPPFRQHGPDGRGGFHAVRDCMAGVPRLPYRLPELLAADADAIVYICEGEKDADRLARLGLIATTNSEGANKFRPELATFFAGRRCIILEDNDDAGRSHAADVMAKLHGVAREAGILRLPDLALKGDVSDWLDAGGTIDALKALSGTALATPDTAETFQLIDLAQWSQGLPEPRQWALAGYVPRGEVTLFTGPGGVGKSLFAQQLATCHAAHIPLLGVDTAGGPTLYLTAEDDDRELHWRQAHIAKALHVGIGALTGKLHMASLRGRLNNELATFDADGRLRPEPAYALLRATIAATKAALVVLDNVAHLFAGNENDRGQVTAFANALNCLCRDLDTTIVLIAHPNKAGDDYSGSTAWLNAVRSQITIKRPDGVDPDARCLTLGKANYARSGEQVEFRWHDFAFVRDADLSDDTRAALAATIASNNENEAFLACLRERAAQGDGRGVGPNPGPNYAPSQFEGMTLARGLSKAALKAAMDRLYAIGAIESETVENKAKGRSLTVIREVPRTSPNALPNASRTVVPNAPEARPNAPAHTLPPFGGDGAGLVAAAPPRSRDISRPVFEATGPILAPGETGDEDVPGWETR